MKQRLLYLLTVIVLVVAMTSGYRASLRAARSSNLQTSPALLTQAQEFFPQAQFFTLSEDPRQWSFVFDSLKNPIGKFVLTKPFVEEKGYGGVVHLLIAANLQDKILGVRIADSSESAGTLRVLCEKKFFDAWNGVSAPEAVQKNVDAVSGATVSSTTVIRALQKRLSLISNSKPVAQPEMLFTRAVVANILALLALAFSLFVFFRKSDSRLWRNVALLVNVAVLGFLTAKMLSLALFYSWIKTGIMFTDAVFVIWVAALAAIFVYNKNIYCHSLCPFGAAQELLGQITRKKFTLSFLPFFRWLGFVYLALIVGLLLAAFPLKLELTEPFAGFLWHDLLSPIGILFGLWLFVSIFVGRFWCNFLCPTGRILRGFLDKGQKVKIVSVVVFILCVALAFAFVRRLQTLTPAQAAVAVPKVVEVKYKLASFFQTLSDGIVQCELCPRQCTLKKNDMGFCRARKNINGKLYALTYGEPVAVHVDPIEKKPFAHVYPGTRSFSIATAGCNLRCKFCQNWEISQMDADQVRGEYIAPETIVAKAKEAGAKTIAFTYTEPVIFYEYMLDIAKLAKQEGIACVMHSAGFVNEKPLRELAPYLLAANIDLKGFDEKFYTTFTSGDLNVVLRTLKVLKDEGVWVEITNLLIPGVNDSDEMIRKLCVWVKDNLGAQTPVHFARFYPMYKLVDLSPTPVATLERAFDIATKEGLQFVYIGNVPDQVGENTFCPQCGKLLIKRAGYQILENNIVDGKCPFCGREIPGLWK